MYMYQMSIVVVSSSVSSATCMCNVMSRIEEDHGDVPALRITVPRNQHRRSSAFSSELSGRFYEPGSFQKLEMQRQSVKREGERKRKQAERHRQHLEKQQNDIERKALQLLQRKKRMAQRRQRREQSAAASTVQRAWRMRRAQSMFETMRRTAYEKHCKSELQWQQERLQQQREQRKVDALKRRAGQSEADLDIRHRAGIDASALFLTQQSCETDVCCSEIVNEGLTSFVDADIVPTLISAADATDTCAFSLDGKLHCMLDTPETPVEEDICSKPGPNAEMLHEVPLQVVNEDDISTKEGESDSVEPSIQKAQKPNQLPRTPDKEQQPRLLPEQPPQTMSPHPKKAQQNKERSQTNEEDSSSAEAREAWAAELLARYGGQCRSHTRSQTKSSTQNNSSQQAQATSMVENTHTYVSSEIRPNIDVNVEPGLGMDDRKRHMSQGPIEPAAPTSSHIASDANARQSGQVVSAAYSPTRNARHKRAILAAQQQKRRSQRRAQAMQRAAAVKAKADDEVRKQEKRARRRKQAAERLAAIEQSREAEAQKRAKMLADSQHRRELQVNEDRFEQERAFMLLLERQQRIETAETNRLARIRAAAARRAREREREADEEAERKALEEQQKAARKADADAAEHERRARLRRLGAQQRKAKKEAEVNAARAKAEADDNKKREREHKVVIFRAALRKRLARQARQQARLAEAEQARAERLHAEQVQQRAAVRARLREQDKKRRRREAAMANQRELEVEAVREATTQKSRRDVQVKETAARRRLGKARAHAACEGRRRVSNQVLDVKEYILQKEREHNIEPSIRSRGTESNSDDDDDDGCVGRNIENDVGSELLTQNFEFDSEVRMASAASATALHTQPQQCLNPSLQVKFSGHEVTNRGPRIRRPVATAKIVGPPKRTHPFLGRGPVRKQKRGGKGAITAVNKGAGRAHHMLEAPPTSSIELGKMLRRARAALAPRGGDLTSESSRPGHLARYEKQLDNESRRLLDLRGERRELEAQLARMRLCANGTTVDCESPGCSDDESVASVGHISEIPPCLPCPSTLMTDNGQVQLETAHDADECSMRMGSCVNGITNATGNTGQGSQRDGGGFPLNVKSDKLIEHMPVGKASCKPALSTVESSEYANEDDDFEVDSDSSYADDFHE